MAYTILKSDGTVLTTIADGMLDQSTSLDLPGPNFVGYGRILNENLVYLLENFASNTAPVSTNLQGQLWFDKFHQTLNVFTDRGYLPVAGITVGTVQPTSAQNGNIWFNTTVNQMFIYGNGIWNLVGPAYTRAQGVSGAIPVTLTEQASTSTTHDIVKIQFGNTVFATLSGQTFVPNTPMPGFSHIFSGLTINESLISGSAQLYTNANTAAYLPTDPTIAGINANVSSLNNTVGVLSANTTAAVAAANLSLTNYLNSEIQVIDGLLASTAANLNATANAIIANTQSSINGITNQITQAEANFAANINLINSGLSGVTAAWTANAVIQQNQINALTAGAYSNANVAAYLPNYNGPIAASVITATTQSYADNSTNVATTAFVQSVLPRGTIVMWGGAIGNIPAGWQLCNGSNSTPDLRDRFVVGAGNSYGTGTTGGASSVALSTSNLPAHAHGFSGSMTISGSTGTSQAQLSDPGHAHTIPYRPNTSGGGGGGFDVGYPQATGYSVSASKTGITDSGHAHSFSGSGSLSGTTSSVGSGAAFNTLPPYYALCYIQKMY
jgi:microcystin-dependent protein